jgi:hypothetical protein
MIRIAAINGSPKISGSVSGMLIETIEGFLNVKMDTFQAIKIVRSEKTAQTAAELLNFDLLLFVFPLYVDQLPAPIIELLTYIERAASAADTQLPAVYSVCNCGFYEAEHNRLALRMLHSFALRAGLAWGYGVGIGGGGLLESMGNITGKGPTANVYDALSALCEAMRAGDVMEHGDILVTPLFPRFLYRMAAEISWHQMAGKNHVRNQLKRKPHCYENI